MSSPVLRTSRPGSSHASVVMTPESEVSAASVRCATRGGPAGPFVPCSVEVNGAPPTLSSRPAIQTLNWLFRPIEFMDKARREHGDAFGVTFLGFETPMYVISDPEAVRALYRGRVDALPPGRTLTLEPILGSRSVLLLEGQEHLARRKLMLPPFHGERMRAYESVIEDIATAEIDSWPIGEAFPIHPRM